MGGPNSNKKSKGGHIYQHKLYAPMEYQGAVKRDAILERIFSDDRIRVVLFQGPAGHGKTTLMQQAVSECKDAGAFTGWMTFDESDNDLQRFFSHFDAILGNINTKLTSHPLVSDEIPETTAPRWGIDWLIDGIESAQCDVCLFFDEFQHLSDPSILAFFRGFLERLPKSIRVFIASRTVPQIGLARLAVNQTSLIFHAEELRFSEAEAVRFFALSEEIPMRDDEVLTIFKQTEGWPAALQLFRLTLSNPSIRTGLADLQSFRLPDLADYLADNVLSLQTTEIQEFLLRTSHLERLCAPLCDAVCNRTGSQEILLFLEKSGLFLRSLDNEQYWFRFHTLFSSFLKSQLKVYSPETILEVNRLACIWYGERGMFSDAIGHAVAACDYALAADILATWSTALVEEAHLKTLEYWYDRLPLDEVEKRPDLTIKVAWALIFLRRHTKLLPILKMLELQFKAGNKVADDDLHIVLSMSSLLDDNFEKTEVHIRSVEVFDAHSDGFRAFHLGAAANLKAFLALLNGDFDSTLSFTSMSRTHSERAKESFAWGYSFSIAGLALLMSGRLNEAKERMRNELSKPRVIVDDSLAAVSLATTYSYVLYEANDIDAAEVELTACMDLLVQATLLDWVAVAYITMARIHDLRGRGDQADALLDDAERIGLANAWPRLIRIVTWERVRRLILKGSIGEARSKASRIGYGEVSHGTNPRWVPFSEDIEGSAIGQARLQIHMGQSKDALKGLGTELAIAQQSGRLRRQVKLITLIAIAHAKLGNENLARRNFREALAIACRCGYFRTILDEGESAASLLRAEHDLIENGQDDSSSIRRYLEAVMQTPEAASQRTRMPQSGRKLDALTDREKEILAFLANGVSNVEMGKKLFVSENTIKYHLKNIYSKLGVSNRLQAILAGRQAGLI